MQTEAVEVRGIGNRHRWQPLTACKPALSCQCQQQSLTYIIIISTAPFGCNFRGADNYWMFMSHCSRLRSSAGGGGVWPNSDKRRQWGLIFTVFLQTSFTDDPLDKSFDNWQRYGTLAWFDVAGWASRMVYLTPTMPHTSRRQFWGNQPNVWWPWKRLVKWKPTMSNRNMNCHYVTCKN